MRERRGLLKPNTHTSRALAATAAFPEGRDISHCTRARRRTCWLNNVTLRSRKQRANIDSTIGDVNQ